MASIVLKTLSVLLGLFFIFVGVMKLTPRINREMHKDLRKSFVQYAKVFPMSQHLGFKVSAKWFRRSVGIVEAVCGLLLVSAPGCLKEMANVILLVVMIGAAYTHHAIGDKFERMAPAIVFTFMLTCRLVVYAQVRLKAPESVEQSAIEQSGVDDQAVVVTEQPSTSSKALKQD